REWSERGASFSRRRSTGGPRSAATCGTQTATSSRWASPLGFSPATWPPSGRRTCRVSTCVQDWRKRMSGPWPSLNYEQWSATCDTLHAHTQVLGKLAVVLAPPEPQLQHAALRLTARG